jgi:hypothetical protein
MYTKNWLEHYIVQRGLTMNSRRWMHPIICDGRRNLDSQDLFNTTKNSKTHYRDCIKNARTSDFLQQQHHGYM